MKTLTFFSALGLLACGMLAFAQDYYAPYPTYYRSSTPAEGALRGMGDLARSAGQYNLTSSQAAINMTEAQKKYIENRNEWTNTYFQMREANKQYRDRERRPRPSLEDMVRYAQAGKPKRLSPSEIDSVTGKIDWPILLKADRYAPYRAELEELFAKRAEHGVLGTDDYLQVRKSTEAMLDELKGQVREVPQMDYIASRRFVESLAFEGSAASS